AGGDGWPMCCFCSRWLPRLLQPEPNRLWTGFAVTGSALLADGQSLRSLPGDERISRDEVAQRPLGGLCDSDARRDRYSADAIAVLDNAQVRARAYEALSIVPLPRYSQGFGHASWPGGNLFEKRNFLEIGFFSYSKSTVNVSSGDCRAALGLAGRGRPSPHDPSRLRHLLEARHRFQSAQQHAAGDAVGQAGNIQAIVIAIDEIHIGVAGRAEENGIPCRAAGSGVRRLVALAEIGFGFDNAPGENSTRRFADQESPQQRPRHVPRI